MKIEIGSKLPNGAIVVAFNHREVLALTMSFGAPYVIWSYDPENLSTYLGHYFTSIADAGIYFDRDNGPNHA